jgi:hypothetical protein
MGPASNAQTVRRFLFISVISSFTPPPRKATARPPAQNDGRGATRLRQGRAAYVLASGEPGQAAARAVRDSVTGSAGGVETAEKGVERPYPP